ncbi:alkaline phosphatase PhoX [Candidatus Palauibacter sp.]|uniref:alkaline phosphatase PhoX n=1 Tax=Candidatus Palauibacter sp. TaxID=3101350 RepID=UPI003B01A762
MSKIARREFVRQAGRLAGAAAMAPSLAGLQARAARGPSAPGPAHPAAGSAGYGPLRPAGPELALPEGFSYAVLSVEGRPMSDGRPTPRAHDGMGLFAVGDDVVRLVRNHEDQDPPGVASPLVSANLAYDPLAGGGTTTLEVRLDADGRPTLLRDFVSLGGTTINCAGGVTPWRTWLSCEETTWGLGRGWSVPHGYVFEVPVDADGPVKAVPIPDMGRFVHEAVAVDPETGFVYETEDYNRRAGFYRFRPRTPGVLVDGGTLEMLAVRGHPQADLRTGQRSGVWHEVDWVPIEHPDPPEAERRATTVWAEGYEAGGARFSRLEGCWYDDRSIYFQATNGGDEQLGQVWRYVPADEALALVFESPSEDVLDGPDNLTVSPRGGILICEDNSGTTHLRGLAPSGEIFPFARNILNRREFAGACFSPDGRTLFINLQGDTISVGPGNLGYTLAIWGPWERGAL